MSARGRYIYIYIYIERERERERDGKKGASEDPRDGGKAVRKVPRRMCCARQSTQHLSDRPEQIVIQLDIPMPMGTALDNTVAGQIVTIWALCAPTALAGLRTSGLPTPACRGEPPNVGSLRDTQPHHAASEGSRRGPP